MLYRVMHHLITVTVLHTVSVSGSWECHVIWMSHSSVFLCLSSNLQGAVFGSGLTCYIFISGWFRIRLPMQLPVTQSNVTQTPLNPVRLCLIFWIASSYFPACSITLLLLYVLDETFHRENHTGMILTARYGCVLLKPLIIDNPLVSSA